MDSINKRWLEVTEILKNRHEILKDNSFAKSIGMTATAFSNLKVGSSNVTLQAIVSLCDNYPEVNGNYILTGKGHPLNDAAEEEKQDTSLESSIAKLLESNSEKDKMILKLTSKLLDVL